MGSVAEHCKPHSTILSPHSSREVPGYGYTCDTKQCWKPRGGRVSFCFQHSHCLVTPKLVSTRMTSGWQDVLCFTGPKCMKLVRQLTTSQVFGKQEEGRWEPHEFVRYVATFGWSSCHQHRSHLVRAYSCTDSQVHDACLEALPPCCGFLAASV